MNKPNGISDKVWETFEDWYHEQEGYGLRSEWFDGDVEWIKAAFAAGRSAISKAIEDTYEECAQIVDGYNDAIGIAGEKGEIMPIAPALAQAIRNRSKGEE